MDPLWLARLQFASTTIFHYFFCSDVHWTCINYCDYANHVRCKR